MNSNTLPNVTSLNASTHGVPLLSSLKLRFELCTLAAVARSRLTAVVLPRLYVNPGDLIWLTEVTMPPVEPLRSFSTMIFFQFLRRDSVNIRLLVARVTS